MMSTFFPPLKKPSTLSYPKLASFNKTRDMEKILGLDDSVDEGKTAIAQKEKKLENRNNAFKKRLKAKYKKLVVR